MAGSKMQLKGGAAELHDKAIDAIIAGAAKLRATIIVPPDPNAHPILAASEGAVAIDVQKFCLDKSFQIWAGICS